jgi:hypothetical protein
MDEAIVTLFKTFGPFQINAEIECKSDDLGIKFNSAHQNLNDASGVYIFAYEGVGSLIPLYVGKAQRQSFATRIAQHLNSGKFSAFLDDHAKKLQIILIARVNGDNKCMRAKVDADEEFSVVSELECSLIGSCAAVNPRLLNLNVLKHPELLRVPGYLGDGPNDLDTSAVTLAKMLRKS